MAEANRRRNMQPAPPDAPTPPAGEPDTAAGDAEQRHHQISEAAYYRAQRRGFTPGAEEEDWFKAEKEIEGGNSGWKAPGRERLSDAEVVTSAVRGPAPASVTPAPAPAARGERGRCVLALRADR